MSRGLGDVYKRQIIGEVKGAVLKLGDNEFTIDELNDSYHGVIEKYMA